jgi:hypothetical protein
MQAGAGLAERLTPQCTTYKIDIFNEFFICLHLVWHKKKFGRFIISLQPVWYLVLLNLQRHCLGYVKCTKGVALWAAALAHSSNEVHSTCLWRSNRVPSFSPPPPISTPLYIGHQVVAHMQCVEFSVCSSPPHVRTCIRLRRGKNALALYEMKREYETVRSCACTRVQAE